MDTPEIVVRRGPVPAEVHWSDETTGDESWFWLTGVELLEGDSRDTPYITVEELKQAAIDQAQWAERLVARHTDYVVARWVAEVPGARWRAVLRRSLYTVRMVMSTGPDRVLVDLTERQANSYAARFEHGTSRVLVHTVGEGVDVREQRIAVRHILVMTTTHELGDEEE